MRFTPVCPKLTYKDVSKTLNLPFQVPNTNSKPVVLVMIQIMTLTSDGIFGGFSQCCIINPPIIPG